VLFIVPFQNKRKQKVRFLFYQITKKQRVTTHIHMLLKQSHTTACVTDAVRLFLHCVPKVMIIEEMRITPLLNKPNLISFFNLEEESINFFCLRQSS
jgi:hypothetical protein